MQKPTGLGVWCATNVLDRAMLTDLAQQVERRGYQSLWYPESLSYESFAMGGFLLSATSTLQVASGIANIYARDPISAAQGHDALNRLYGDRFVLGLGVSHVPLVEGARGHDYKKPVTTMRAYLQAMFELIFLAFRTDSTRVATYMIGRENGVGHSDHLARAVGFPLSHELSHEIKNPGGWKNFSNKESTRSG